MWNDGAVYRRIGKYRRMSGMTQTPLHGHGLQTCWTTPPTDKLTTILQLAVQQICHIAMSEPNISTCQDAGMWQIFVRWWWICCTASCRIVVSSSVGGVVQHVRSRCPCSWSLALCQHCKTKATGRNWPVDSTRQFLVTHFIWGRKVKSQGYKVK